MSAELEELRDQFVEEIESKIRGLINETVDDFPSISFLTEGNIIPIKALFIGWEWDRRGHPDLVYLKPDGNYGRGSLYRMENDQHDEIYIPMYENEILEAFRDPDRRGDLLRYGISTVKALERERERQNRPADQITA